MESTRMFVGGEKGGKAGGQKQGTREGGSVFKEALDFYVMKSHMFIVKNERKLQTPPLLPAWIFSLGQFFSLNICMISFSFVFV